MSRQPTADEARNGWDADKLEAYLAQRDEMVAGNVVTEFKLPTPPIKLESALRFNPHRWNRT